MSSTSKSAELLANAKQAIDAILNAPELDDDTKEDIFGEIQDHLEEAERLLSDEEEDEEDEEEDADDIEIDDDEEDEAK